MTLDAKHKKVVANDMQLRDDVVEMGRIEAAVRREEKQNQNAAQRNAEVVNEAWSGRAVLILEGGATK